MTISRIEPVSLARIQGLIYAAIGLLIGLPAGCIALIGGGFAGGAEGLGIGAMGVAAVIVYPLMLGIMGFLAGLLTAFVYNVVADRVGGVEIDVEGDQLDLNSDQML